VTTIYLLSDPRGQNPTQSIRYVGRTTRRWTIRLTQHLCDARHRADARSRWLCDLEAAGLKPEMRVLEQVDDSAATEREAFYIRHYAEAGCALVNVDGVPIRQPSLPSKTLPCVLPLLAAEYDPPPTPASEISAAARHLGAIGGKANTPAQQAHRQRLHESSPHAGRPRRTLWAAIARMDGKDAGHVCYGLTKDECRAKARQQTTVSFVIRRGRATQGQIAALIAVGKV
jgi:hypothetical protein